MNIYHKLKVSYISRYVIIKHALVKELLILQVQNDDIYMDVTPGSSLLIIYESLGLFVLNNPCVTRGSSLLMICESLGGVCAVESVRLL